MPRGVYYRCLQWICEPQPHVFLTRGIAVPRVSIIQQACFGVKLRQAFLSLIAAPCPAAGMGWHRQPWLQAPAWMQQGRLRSVSGGYLYGPQRPIDRPLCHPGPWAPLAYPRKANAPTEALRAVRAFAAHWVPPGKQSFLRGHPSLTGTLHAQPRRSGSCSNSAGS